MNSQVSIAALNLDQRMLYFFARVYSISYYNQTHDSVDFGKSDASSHRWNAGVFVIARTLSALWSIQIQERVFFYNADSITD